MEMLNEMSDISSESSYDSNDNRKGSPGASRRENLNRSKKLRHTSSQGCLKLSRESLHTLNTTDSEAER